jgi:hypothetical protein
MVTAFGHAVSEAACVGMNEPPCWSTLGAALWFSGTNSKEAQSKRSLVHSSYVVVDRPLASVAYG